MEQDSELSGIGFVTYRTPHVIWDAHLAETQVNFLKGVVPRYFDHIVRLHEQQLEDEDSIAAAMAIRIAYSHSLETLFALIGAALQAPECPAGWMLSYTNSELRALVELIQQTTSPSFEYLREVRAGKHNQLQLLNRWGLDRPQWSDVAIALFPWEGENDDHLVLQSQAAELWEAMAKDFLDSDLELEYNSIKHGMRASQGGGYLAIGREDVPGVPSPPERMRTMMSSPFGSSLLRRERIKGISFQLDHKRVNWDPKVLCRRVELVSTSIGNILQSLLIRNGEKELDVRFAIFQDGVLENALDDPTSSLIQRWSFQTNIAPDSVPDISKADVLDSYRLEAEQSEASGNV